jgi:alkyl hydroperoxide reductase subunit AhpC
MITVRNKFPDFNLKACVSIAPGQEFKDISRNDYKGKWLVMFSWPMDFTFVCPTEIAGFSEKTGEFERLGAKVLGLSTDTHFVHLAWRKDHKDLKNLSFPMLADTKRELSTALGILHEDGVCLRATYIVDPEGTVRWVSVNDLSVGRNVDEVIRTLAALQTGELCPVNWKAGDKTLG